MKGFPIVSVWGKWQEEKVCACPAHSIFFCMFSIYSWIPVCKACGYGKQAVSPYMDACIIAVLISSWVSASICPLGLMSLLCILQMRKVMLKALKWLIEGHTTLRGRIEVESQSCLADARVQKGFLSALWCLLLSLAWVAWERMNKFGICVVFFQLLCMTVGKSVGSCRALLFTKEMLLPLHPGLLKWNFSKILLKIVSFSF